MSHMHTHDDGGGIASGMVVGIVLALLVAVLLAFLLFGGMGTGTDDEGGLNDGLDGDVPAPQIDPEVPDGLEDDGGMGGVDPTSYQYYIVPDHQVTVR